VEPDEHKALLDAAPNPEFRDFLVVQEMAGGRPSEILAATPGAWHGDHLVYLPWDQLGPDGFKHKTGGKGGPRTLWFTGQALEVMRRRAAEAKARGGDKARLFPVLNPVRPGLDVTGQALDAAEKAAKRLLYLREKLGLRDTLTLYSYRHASQTRNRKAGLSLDETARLAGNSPAEVARTYDHSQECGDYMRGLAARANGDTREADRQTLLSLVERNGLAAVREWLDGMGPRLADLA
jgi:hypothetical protein